MQEWFLKQWNDIKGNAKFAAIGLGWTTALALVGLLTHGLAWWQQAILLFVFGAVLVWAIAATVLAVRRDKSRPDVTSARPAETSLRERVFTLCTELSAYMGEREPRPDEGTIFANFKDSAKLFSEHYDTEIQSWDDKLSAGYWLHFKERAVGLRHELVLNEVRDGSIDNALSSLDQQPDNNYMKVMQTLIEQMRYAASRLP